MVSRLCLGDLVVLRLCLGYVLGGVSVVSWFLVVSRLCLGGVSVGGVSFVFW